MPKAGMVMEEGKIIKWLVKAGETVKEGDPLLEIETDKTSMEVEATSSGTLLKIIAQDGDTVPVTQIIGYLGIPGEKIEEDAPLAAAAPIERKTEEKPSAPSAGILGKNGKISATPSAKRIAKEKGIGLNEIIPSGFYGEIKARDVLAAGKKKITPLAQKIAETEGIDLKDSIPGNGRIYSADVKNLMKKNGADRTPEYVQEDGDIQKPLSGMRKTIASRMMASHSEIPPVTLDTKADVTGLLFERKKRNASGGEKISINDYVMHAGARAFLDMPHMNCSFAGDSVIIRKHVNIGVAVALEEGLIVPVVRNADRLSLEGISQSVKELADRARKGKLAPDEYTGGTFTVSNLGMYGITFFTPIINQPESMILGVCAIEKVFEMRDDGTLGNRDVMGLSLTFDHRVHDGASGALFLKKIVEYLESFNGKAGER